MSWDEAMTAAQTNPKKLYVDIYTDWCGYCKKMDNTTFKDPKVVEYLNENFYPVKFNAEQKETINFNNTEFNYISGGGRGVHELAYALLNGRLGYPAFVILDEEFARILISPGYKYADDVMMEMEFATKEMYKTTAWSTYMAQYQASKNPAANPGAVKPNPANPNGTAKKASVDTAPANLREGNANAANGSTSNNQNPEREVFKVVEKMPIFSGCENIEGTNEEISKCSTGKMLEFVYKTLRYPALARENGIEGMVVVQYIIDKEGMVRDAKIVTDIGQGCGEAALDVVNQMPAWTPGMQRGKPVDVQYTLPIKFKLESDKKTKKKKRRSKADQ